MKELREFWNDLDRNERLDALGMAVVGIGGYFWIVLLSAIFG